MGIDIFEVIEAAKTKPFGFMAFYPGPGLGGHCIPIDPFYLTWKAHEYGIHTRFIELAGEINSDMPRYVVEQVARAVDHHNGCGLSTSRLLVIGAAYKKNIDDIRESPALVIMELLEARGAGVDYYDPLVPIIPQTREHPRLVGKKSIKFSCSIIEKYDAVLVVTDHDIIDWDGVIRSAKLLIDTRNVAGRFPALCAVAKIWQA
jgi:UDP-N-acetyl-D-glucosamine dehydrogenase